MKKKRKIKKSLWIPLAFTVYAIIVYAYFLPRNSAGTLEIAITLGVNVLIIIALWFLYRKKEEMTRQREEEMKNPPKQN